MTSDDLSEIVRLPEDVAHRLLARAVELDASHASEVTIAQLREAAQDAGISLAAFEAALAELQRAKMHRNDQPIARPRVPLNRIGVWLGLVEPDRSAAAIKETLLRSAVALAVLRLRPT